MDGPRAQPKRASSLTGNRGRPFLKPEGMAGRGYEQRFLEKRSVQAIRLVNEGTGYDTRSRKELDEYFEPLKVS